MNDDAMSDRAAAGGHACPRAILIGTDRTLPGLAAQIGSLSGGIDVLGSVRADGEPLGEALTVSGRTGPGLTVRGLGGLDDLPTIARTLKPAVALVSLPTERADLILRVRVMLGELGVGERLVPVLDELIAEPGTIGMLSAIGSGPASLGPRIDTATLVDRTPHEIDRAAVGRQITGRRVLVTGAGGSIGSELARVACGFEPDLIVLMDRSENALFEIDRQLARRFPQVRRRPILHDVVDAEATLRRLGEIKPHLVLHAAAHKHVPLMEEHPADAVRNNLFGTKSVADASQRVGVERMVLVSTDKAVNPTSVMGATKRLAERYVQCLHHRSHGGSHGELHGQGGGDGTRYAIVRFGNVLGSAGSVLPIWSAQLAEGGPVTLTDPRMTRYFMTIREAASLVLQAASMDGVCAPNSPVFVLDMGKPCRILDLAERFVRAHGYEPRLVRHATDPAVLEAQDGVLALAQDLPTKDLSRPAIDIVVTGIRPGEKLHEELAYGAELLEGTEHPGVTAWTAESPPLADVAELVADMSRVRASENHHEVLEAIMRHVPELVRPEPVRQAG